MKTKIHFILGFVIGITLTIAVMIEIKFCASEKEPFPRSAHADIIDQQWLAMDHARHETSIENCERQVEELDAHVNACEDAWQSDLSECHLEFEEYKIKTDDYMQICGE
jgi:hypothetical protein